MQAETTVRKIGNSQGVTIPKEMCELAGLPVGKRVQVSTEADGIKITAARGRTLFDRLGEWDGVRYAAPEIDWGRPVGSEMW